MAAPAILQATGGSWLGLIQAFAPTPIVLCVLDDAIHRTYNALVTALSFEWDPPKAAANARKHGVSFQEAVSVFADERARLMDDPDHSGDEDRFLLLGLSASLRLLVVCHCHRESQGVIRLISARKATRAESTQYP